MQTAELVVCVHCNYERVSRSAPSCPNCGRDKFNPEGSGEMGSRLNILTFSYRWPPRRSNDARLQIAENGSGVSDEGVERTASALSAHFADELGQGDAGQMFSDGLLGAFGHAAHDALHVAAHAALL